MKQRKSRTISQAAQPAQPTREAWVSKQQAAQMLAIGTRQVEQLIRKEGWRTTKQKLSGKRQASRMIEIADVKAYQLRKTAPTIDHATGQQLARRADPTGVRTAPASFGAIMAHAVHEFGQVADSIAKRLQAEPTIPPYRWLTLREAAAHIGLPPSYLRQVCDQDRLPFITVGSGKNAQRMVRAGDAEQLDARQAEGPQ